MFSAAMQLMIMHESIEIIYKNIVFFSPSPINNKSTCFCDRNWTRTHNHLVHKRTLNHLAKLASND